MSGLFENFHERIERAYDVLRGAETAFVVVSSREEQVLGDAEYLASKMAELRMPLKGVVMNRVHAELRREKRGTIDPDDLDAVSRLVADAVGAANAPALVENFVDYQTLARGEQLRIEQFRAGLPKRVPMVTVPNFSRDVHDLATLAAMHPFLFG
jgi:anion-transporting  ArsA/GET3 family ATPase